MVSIVDIVTRAEEVAVTTLAQPAHAAAATLTVLHAGSLAPPPNVVQIGAEYIRYDGIAGNALTGCTRGVRLGNAGGPPSDHAHGAGVAQGATILNHMWPGTMLPYGGAAAPPGWLPCNGAAVGRATYAALYAVIGTSFGAGDGSTTFNLPDARGRVLVGYDAGQPEFDAIGEAGGAKAVTLTAAQSGLPAHEHTLSTHVHGSPLPRGDGAANAARDPTNDNPTTTGGTAQNAAEAHTNLQPYLVGGHWIIKF